MTLNLTLNLTLTQTLTHVFNPDAFLFLVLA